MTTLTDEQTADVAEVSSPRDVPSAALRLGMAGAVPFVLCALAAVSLSGDLASIAQQALLYYGAVILAFLGGVHWGLAIKDVAVEHVSANRLATSVGPSLIGWAALLLPPTGGLLVMTAAFAVVLAIDLRAASVGETPEWYPTLRVPLTLVVMASLVVGAFA